MINLGTVRPGSTVYIPFHTFSSNDPSASVTLTGLAATDIEIYKDGGTTQRASDTGYTLLDTDGIDFDGTTGIHGFSLDLSSNATADFFTSGGRFWVVVASVTVDAATINFVAATFYIGYDGAIVDTTLATLASQTSFTLTVGSADDDAYNGCAVIIHDIASGIQVATGVVSDYTGSSKTVTLAADPGIFTMAASDHISIFMPANTRWLGGTVQTAGDVAADTAAILVDTAELGAAVGASLSADIAAVKAETVLIVADTNELQADDYPTTIAAIKSETALIVADTNELQTDDYPTTIAAVQTAADAILVDTADMQPKLGTPAADVSADIAAIEAQTDDIGTAGAGLTAVPWNSAWDAEVQSEVVDALVAQGLDHLVLQRTTIATLASQTSFTLTAGSADNSPYIGCMIVIEDASTAVQKAVGVISAYTGSTRTVTLLNDPAIFTMATTDLVTIIPDRSLKPATDNRTITVESDGDLAKVNTLDGHTAQTGDNYARLAAPAGASVSADIAAIKTETALIVADTNELQTDDYPTTIAAVQTTADAIETDTQNIQSRVPTALVSDRMSSDTVAISGSTDAADKLEASAETMQIGAAEAGTLSTTQMTSDLTEATDDHYNGRLIIWTSGVLLRQATDITDYSGATGLLTYTATTEAPSAADTFVIV